MKVKSNGSLYLWASEVIIGFLSRFSLNNRWQSWLRRRRGLERSPMWAAEVFQIASIVFVVSLLSLVARFEWPLWVRWVLGILAGYRLADIAIFALHWLLVDRRLVKDFRRSFLSFTLNLVELGLYGTLLLHSLGETLLGPWALVYQLTAAIFTLSLPPDDGWGMLSVVVTHIILAISWILVLVVIAVVLSGISRGERGTDDHPA